MEDRTHLYFAAGSWPAGKTYRGAVFTNCSCSCPQHGMCLQFGGRTRQGMVEIADSRLCTDRQVESASRLQWRKWIGAAVLEWERSRAEFRYMKCLGLKLRYTHCCMGIVGTGAGATHMRAVCVEDSEQAAGGTWMWVGARPALAEGAAVCSGWPEPHRPARALPVFGRWRAPLPLPG